MTKVDEITKLKNLPPLAQVGCGTCRFYVPHRILTLAGCEATSSYADGSWRNQCKGGQLWQPKPPPIPILIRFKRWLVG